MIFTKSRFLAKMRKHREKWPNMAPRASQREVDQKCCRSPRCPVWPLLGIYQALKCPRKTSYHAGGTGTPAHCDASRSSAGVLFRDSAPAFFKFVNAPPDSPPNSSKIHSKIGPNPPKTLPNPPEIFPNPSQNRPKIDPEAFLEPILD